MPVLAVLLAITIATAPGSAPARAAGGARLDAVERHVIRLVNRQRARLGLRRLRPVRRLARAADFHCRDMRGGRFFAHASRNGTSVAARVARFRRARATGETLAWLSSGPSQASRVVAMWMSSPGHRAVLLSPAFRRIGLARRAGIFGGRRAFVFTADLQSRT